jgi:hypothetical protein
MELVERGSYDRPLSGEQVAEDLDILVTTLRRNHPGVFDYQTPVEQARLVAELTPAKDAELTVLDEYRIASRIIAAVGDAHTYALNPCYTRILQEEPLFPRMPTIDRNQLTLEGRRVKTINGLPAEDLLRRLHQYAGSDGGTLPYKNAFIELEFPLKYFTFIDDTAAFEVVLEDGKQLFLQGKSYFTEGLRPAPPPPALSIEKDTATLRIPIWEDETAASFNNDLAEMTRTSNLAAFVRASMDDVIDAGANHLKIDLRGNTGGKSGPAALLLSYLIDRPFDYYGAIRVAADSFPTAPYIRNQELVEFYQSPDARRLIESRASGYYFRDELLPKITPQPRQFPGTVEVLVDKYSLSVSTDVVAVLQGNRPVTVTGPEFGGSLEHYCAGNYLDLVLPHSGIEVNVPLQRLEYANSQR